MNNQFETFHRAKQNKNDEFYTRYEDIEKEISCYNTEIFKDKIIYCNCDSENSNFVKFFKNNFDVLKIKDLLYTSDNCFSLSNTQKLYNSDIIITNPPFSRSVEYWNMIINSKKQFLIISNAIITTSITYIPYFNNKTIVPGHNSVEHFLNSNKRINGFWFTNFPIIKREKHKNLKFVNLKEIPDKYKHYDDNGLLLVDRNYIPTDCDNFAVSYYSILCGILDFDYKINQSKDYIPYINGKAKFARIILKGKNNE